MQTWLLCFVIEFHLNQSLYIPVWLLFKGVGWMGAGASAHEGGGGGSRQRSQNGSEWE